MWKAIALHFFFTAAKWRDGSAVDLVSTVEFYCWERKQNLFTFILSDCVLILTQFWIFSVRFGLHLPSFRGTRQSCHQNIKFRREQQTRVSFLSVGICIHVMTEKSSRQNCGNRNPDLKKKHQIFLINPPNGRTCTREKHTK